MGCIGMASAFSNAFSEQQGFSELEKRIIASNLTFKRNGSITSNAAFEDYLDEYIGNAKVAVPYDEFDENGNMITYYNIQLLKLKDDSFIFKDVKKEYDKIIPEFLESDKSELELKAPGVFEFDIREYGENLEKVYKLKKEGISIKYLEDKVILEKPKSNC